MSPHELERVKKRILHHGLVTQVTTFEALAAMTWQARTQAVDMHPKQVARLVFPVNIRSKLDPPLPARFLGNGVFLGHATATPAELRANGKESALIARCTCGAFADEISAHPKISNDIGEVFFRLALISRVHPTRGQARSLHKRRPCSGCC